MMGFYDSIKSNMYDVKIITHRVETNNRGDKFHYMNDLLHHEDGPAIEYANGDKEYYLNGKLHREDGPAKEFINGDEIWYKNGKLHRENGPAIKYSHGAEYWYLNGNLHREGGPAIVEVYGKAYFIHGKECLDNREKLTDDQKSRDYFRVLENTKGQETY